MKRLLFKMIILAFLLPLSLLLVTETALAKKPHTFSVTVKIRNLPANWAVTDTSYKLIPLTRSSDGTAIIPTFNLKYTFSSVSKKLYVFNGQKRMGAIIVGANYYNVSNMTGYQSGSNNPLYRATGVVSFDHLVRHCCAPEIHTRGGSQYITYNYTYIFVINK